jgi:hypothetical protein
VNEITRTQLLESALDRILRLISAADSRIAPLMTIDLAMLGFIAALLPTSPKFSALLTFFALASIVFLGLSLWWIFHTAFPRIEGPGGSIIFFGAIVKHSAEKYRELTLALSGSGYFDDLVYQCHRNSQIAHEKFKAVRNAMKFLGWAVVPWVAAIVLYYYEKVHS